MATLAKGSDSEGGERFGNCEYNDIKNHWRTSDPCANLSDLQPGMIVSDENDDRLYVVSLVSGCDCSEILQACVPLSSDVYHGYGDSWEAGFGYSTAHCALMMGIPVSALDSGACERGLIIMDEADLAAGADVTGVVPPSMAEPSVFIVDSDLDSYLGIGLQIDDRPGIWSGPSDAIPLALQYEATADITLFEASGPGENRLAIIYGYITASLTARYSSFSMDDTNDEFEWAAENHSDHEGNTIYLPEEYQRFRIRGTGRTLFYEFEPNNANGPYGAIHDVDGDSLWEFGWFADDVGLLTIPANPLRENMITNSGIGVWSQSDANKGIAELVFDNGTVAPVVGEAIVGVSGTGKIMWVNVTNNDWAGGNGAGTAYLGAVTGAYEDNETIAGGVAASFDVNGDLNIGVKNDPMNDNSVASWTDDGVNITLAFAAAEYTVVTALANQRAWIAAAPLTAGKIYKIEADIKDGTVAARHVEGYFNDGAAQYGKPEVTAAGWASVSWVFECATTTGAGLAGFRVVENMGGGGNNFEIRRFSCYEITPCCTVADTVAMDTWIKDSTADIYREHSGANVQDGSFYASKLVVANASDYVRFPGAFYNNEEWYMQFQSRTVTLGKWVKTSTASHARLAITDSAGTTSSAYHTGGGAYEWLEVTRTINAGATSVAFYVYGDVVPNVDGTTIIYHCQGTMVFGASIGEGNYRPRQQEWVYGEVYVLGNLLQAASGLSDTAATEINLEADSDARLPKGAKEIDLRLSVNDSGSAGVAVCYVALRASATEGNQFIASCAGLANDALYFKNSNQKLNPDGDYEYSIDASGANTLDTATYLYLGVRVN